MKLDNPTAQFDLQSVGGNSKLDDIGVFTLVWDCLVMLAHHNTPPWVRHAHQSADESKMPITENGSEKERFDWLTWAIGFLCGVVTTLVLVPH